MSAEVWVTARIVGIRDFRVFLVSGEKQCLCPITLAAKVALIAAPNDKDLLAELKRQAPAIKKTLRKLRKRCNEVRIES